VPEKQDKAVQESNCGQAEHGYFPDQLQQMTEDVDTGMCQPGDKCRCHLGGVSDTFEESGNDAVIYVDYRLQGDCDKVHDFDKATEHVR